MERKYFKAVVRSSTRMNCLKTGLFQGQEPVSGGALDGELVGGTDNFAQDPRTDLTNLQDM
jgi:hypothetical protein